MVKHAERPTAPAPPDPDRPLVVEVGLPDMGMCGNGSAIKHELTGLRRVAREEGYHAAWMALIDYYCNRAAYDFERSAIELEQEAIGKAQTAREVGGLWQVGKVGVKVRARWHPVWAARPLDDDNLWRGLKSTLDGIAELGIVRNDRQFYMNGAIEWARAETIAESGVTLTIAPAEWWGKHRGGDNSAGKAGQQVDGDRARAREKGGRSNGGDSRARDRAADPSPTEQLGARSVVQRPGSSASRDSVSDNLHRAATRGAAPVEREWQALTPAEVEATIAILAKTVQRLESASGYLTEATEPAVADRFRDVCPVCHRILPAGVKVLDESPHHAPTCYAVAAGLAYMKLLGVAQREG